MATNGMSFLTHEQGKDITVQGTLLGEEDAQSTDISKPFLDLNRLWEKERKIKLHCITLSDYCGGVGGYDPPWIRD